MSSRRPALSVAVKEQILTLIRSGEFPPDMKLPAEDELSLRFGVSRVTLREALHRLEEEGLIRRQHGVGTFVNLKTPPITFQLEVNVALSEVLASTGLQQGLASQSVRLVAAPDDVGQALELRPGDLVWELQRVRTANGRPVVFSTDFLPVDVVGEAIPTLSGSLYKALTEQFGQTIVEGVADVMPARVTGPLAVALQVSEGCLAMLIEQVDRGAVGRPILLSREYYLSDAFQFRVRRQRQAWEDNAGL